MISLRAHTFVILPFAISITALMGVLRHGPSGPSSDNLEKRGASIWTAIVGYEDVAPVRSDQNAALFCFAMSRSAKSGESQVDVSPDCRRKGLLSHPNAICGFQNLNRGRWDPTIVLTDPVRIATQISTAASEVSCSAYVLDVEEAGSGFTPWISAVIRNLRDLNPNSKITIPVYAKTDAKGLWEAPSHQDWRALCESSDELLIMAYDYVTPAHGTPGDIAPSAWVQSVLTFGLKQCPSQRLRLGLAAYGYDWLSRKSLSEHEFVKAGSPQNPSIHVETVSRRWEKIRMARAMGVTRFFIWTNGQQVH